MSETVSDKERMEAFIRDLTEITRKHGVAIGGCGCCGSPYLDDEASVHQEAGYAFLDGWNTHLCWIHPKHLWWKQNMKDIIR